MRFTTSKAGRLAMVSATGAFMMGLAVLNGGGAQAIGGLCNGEPASHTWLDASGQPGPAVIDGTHGDDTIIGSDGDDTIDGRGGNGFICGGAGNDSISGVLPAAGLDVRQSVPPAWRVHPVSWRQSDDGRRWWRLLRPSVLALAAGQPRGGFAGRKSICVSGSQSAWDGCTAAAPSGRAAFG